MEQLERAKRYLDKIERIYAGVFSAHGHDNESYNDDFISFFIHCYHVRDWIIHLNKTGVAANQVDYFINQHLPLKICADLANGSKHCKLTRSLRTIHQPHLAANDRMITTWYVGGGGGEVMQSKYLILSGSTSYDARNLARECIQLWDSYIAELNAIAS